MRRYLISCMNVVLLASLVMISHSVLAAEPPTLVLQITIDQLRGDMLSRYEHRFGKNGFRYLLDKGIVYRNAHHGHANTETVVGHATLATGAQPSVHGMIGNIWYDRATGSTRYNIEDANYTLLTAGASVDKSTELDPTQKAAKSEGRSPEAILTTTFSDELALYSNGKSKIFGVSIKDRAAVTMAGHVGKAFWFSKATQQFVTSNYYYDKYPEWVVAWNKQKIPQNYSGKTWALMLEQSSYTFGQQDDQPWESVVGDYGRTFPHPFGGSDNPYFSTLLTLSPAGDELTSAFAKTLLKAEGLGDDAVTDFLSVSFSSTDYVGHIFGPSSLEAEDNLLHLDRTLADLLAFVDKEVGLKNTLIVLSADHGTPEAPGYLESIGIPASYVSPDAWDSADAIKRVKKKLGIRGKLFEGFDHPYLYVTNDILNNPAIDIAKLEEAIATELTAFPGVWAAIPSTALKRGAVPDDDLMRAVLNNYHPARSGNIYVVFQPGWFINDMDGLSVSVTHGSPWRYDTFVPIIFAGNGIRAQKIYREVATVDVAVTLATVLNTRLPSGASGEVLTEVVSNR